MKLKNYILTFGQMLMYICILISYTWNKGFSQDIHASQSEFSIQNLSPSLIGLTKADHRFLATYRSQWHSANSPYTTFTGSYDTRINKVNLKNDHIGVGGGINYDVAGDGELGSIHILGAISYIKGISKNHFLSVGIQGGYGNRFFSPEQLTFGTQFNGEEFDPDKSKNETFDNTSKVFFDFSVGLNYRFQSTKNRSKFDFGIGVFHLNEPNQAFNNDIQFPLYKRVSIYLMPTIQISQTLDLVFPGLYQMQGPHIEGMFGIGGRLHLNQKLTKELAIQFNVSMRVNNVADAIIPSFQVHYKSMVVGFSYDLNTSDYRVASNRNGGPELSLKYTINKVKMLNKLKLCPII